MACTLSSKMRERERNLFLNRLSSPLNLKTVQPPPPPPSKTHLVHVRPNPLKNQIFPGTTIIKLKVTKFLVTLSHFKFLLNTDKSIFLYNIFFSLNISDSILSFLQKLGGGGILF